MLIKPNSKTSLIYLLIYLFILFYFLFLFIYFFVAVCFLFFREDRLNNKVWFWRGGEIIDTKVSTAASPSHTSTWYLHIIMDSNNLVRYQLETKDKILSSGLMWQGEILVTINLYTVIQGWNKAVWGALINYEHTIMRFGVVTLAVWGAVHNPGPSYLLDISLRNLIWLYPIM